MRPAPVLVALATLLIARAALAQNPGSPASTARPADVASLDALVAAVYDVISGPAGKERDWGRFRSLFAPGARLVPSGKDSTGMGRLQTWTPDEYAARAGPRLKENGFFEREIGRHVDRYGNIVQLFSAYDSKRAKDDPKPFARGINSMQAFFDGKRWWMVSIYWEGETAANPIPAEYLKKG